MNEYDSIKKWKNVTEARQTNEETAYWKTQAVAAVKHMLELTAFLRHIMTLGLLRGSSRLTARALQILDGIEASDIEGSVTQDVLKHIKNHMNPSDPSLAEDDGCPDCDGTGEVAGDYSSEDGVTTCQRCGGKGTI